MFGRDTLHQDMGQSPDSEDEAGAVRLVRDSLQGPVIDILRDNIPGLKGLSRSEAYERIMNNPALADRCFKFFRSSPEAFRRLMIGSNARPVHNDDHPLTCGRSLNQVITLIVRAIAKRHFRARFRPAPRQGTVKRSPSLLKRIVSMVVTESEPSPIARRRRITRGDSLYQALRDFLLYEWQVPLIPHYAPLPIPLVRSLGARILEYRDANQLQELAKTGLPPMSRDLPGGAPQGGTAARHLPPQTTGNRARSKADIMWSVVMSLELAKMFGISEDEMRQTVNNTAAINPQAFAAMASAGFRMREAVVVLCSLERQVGHRRMRDLLGIGATPQFLTDLIVQLKKENAQQLTEPALVRQATLHAIDVMRSLEKFH